MRYSGYSKSQQQKYNDGFQGLREGEKGKLLFSEYTVLVLEDEESSGDGCWGWLHNNVNVFNINELCT